MTSKISEFFTVKQYCDMPEFSGFTVSGADANSFLQGQLTNDVNGLAAQTSQRAGYCTPKGRLMATFLQWRIGPTTLGHVMPTGLFESTTKRLKMFVLRSKVTFDALDAPLKVLGLWGAFTPAGQQALGSLGDKAGVAVIDLGSESAAGPWLVVESACPVLGTRAWLVAASVDQSAIMDELGQATKISSNAWRFAEIQNGKPWVWEPTKEAFVPQMINFELVNGVSFTKGCYPGQEVVARSQYLGKLKRRSFRADLESASVSTGSLAGADVWCTKIPHEPCGQVVDAAQNIDANGNPAPGACLLIECTLDAWDQGELRVGSLDGAPLTKKVLPYNFPAAE